MTVQKAETKKERMMAMAAMMFRGVTGLPYRAVKRKDGQDIVLLTTSEMNAWLEKNEEED